MGGPRIGSGKPAAAHGSLADRIDRSIALGIVRPGLPAYALAFEAYERSQRTSGDFHQLEQTVVEIAAEDYRRGVGRGVELLEFGDGANRCLFDATLDRTVMMWGLSRQVAENSRDDAYHRGYPRREGYEKGHALSHAQGGLEGGPNYFPQRGAVNRSISDRGKLWRAIETYLAANAGLFAFVRLVYPGGGAGDVPAEMEYGLIDATGRFRVARFGNV
jgi:hypothetical protein